MDTQQSRHVVLEDTPSDIVTPPVIPVQMPTTQTLHTISHDQAAVIPSMITPVTIIEDPRSRMDRLERRIGQMRDPDEMISWDDPNDEPMATLPVGFRMPDIERYAGVGCPRIHLRSLHPRFARHLTGVPFQDFRSLVQALIDVDDGISRGLWSDITHSLDTEGRELVDHLRAMEASDFPPLQHRHPHSVQQYPSVHPHTVTVRPSFQFQRPQTSIPRHEQSRLHRRRQRTYSDLGMSLDRAFERLRSIGFLAPLPLGHARVPCLRVFVLMSSVHFTRWQAIVLIIVLLYVIPYRILLTVVRVLDSFSIVTGPRAEIEGMMVMIFSEYIEIKLLQASIVIERSSRSSDAFIATLDFTDTCYFGCLASTTSPAFSTPAAFLIHFIGYVGTTSAPAMGFLAPLAPRALPDPVPPQFRLDLYCMYHQSVGHHTDCCTALRHAIQDIVDSGTFGHPPSDMFPIPTSA
ncbi:hypothetical protein CK203_057693 [Vitis vinifera]|uniref:Uncharacterized protein n=1 Tax=Vitis vinifera TaxID=29760 RepID=A0A438G0K1_VITVI|nr:hypothetical protein CK203_057693 [Vitis vinifera]